MYFHHVLSIFKMKLLLLVCLVITSSTSEDSGRIIGGTNATEGSYPFMAMVWSPIVNSTFYNVCGGAILNQYWVLTAAHCGLPTFVRMGNNDYKKHIAHYTIFTRIFFNYDNTTQENDIMLLRTAKKILFIPNLIQPISIYNGTVPNEAPLSLSGWGWTQESQLANYLQVLNYTYVNQSMCAYFNKMTPRKTGNYFNVNSNMCALSEIRSGACYGDSGGPLVYNGKVVGITSRMMGMACSCGYPDIFVNVPYFASKIEKVISK